MCFQEGGGCRVQHRLVSFRVGHVRRGRPKCFTFQARNGRGLRQLPSQSSRKPYPEVSPKTSRRQHRTRACLLLRAGTGFLLSRFEKSTVNPASWLRRLSKAPQAEGQTLTEEASQVMLESTPKSTVSWLTTLEASGKTPRALECWAKVQGCRRKCAKWRMPRHHTMRPKPFRTDNCNLEGSQLNWARQSGHRGNGSNSAVGAGELGLVRGGSARLPPPLLPSTGAQSDR